MLTVSLVVETHSVPIGVHCRSAPTVNGPAYAFFRRLGPPPWLFSDYSALAGVGLSARLKKL